MSVSGIVLIMYLFSEPLALVLHLASPNYLLSYLTHVWLSGPPAIRLSTLAWSSSRLLVSILALLDVWLGLARFR